MHVILVRGANEVASAVAHHLFVAGYPVAIHEDAVPFTSRRTVAFSDAVFDGKACLNDVRAERLDALTDLGRLLAAHKAIPVLLQPFQEILAVLSPDILIDARMRKREIPEDQRGLAPLTIGLGPNFVAAENADWIVETGWGDDLGRVSDHGSTRPLKGDPHPIDGHSRDRFVYAPLPGVFHTGCSIGRLVTAGELIAHIDETPIHAPLAGRLRGLTHDGVPISRGAKLVEVDPRGSEASPPAQIGTRPDRIAAGVLMAVQRWLGNAGSPGELIRPA